MTHHLLRVRCIQRRSLQYSFGINNRCRYPFDTLASVTSFSSSSSSSSKDPTKDNPNDYKSPNTINNLNNNHKYQQQHVVIPGMHNMYGSLQDSHSVVRNQPLQEQGSHPIPIDRMTPMSWQALDNAEVQRVTVKAMIYELIHQQTVTIEQTVPWFLEKMPSSYFRQVPEWLRMEHIKAIAAVKDAQMDLYLNLSTHLPDGRQVLTFIRPSTEAGTLLQMVQELPENNKYNNDTPLSRLHVFSTSDETMSLNMFIYGKSFQSETSIEYINTIALPILQYAEQLQSGIYHDDNSSTIDQLQPNDLFHNDTLIEYLKDCTETYLRIGSDDPKRFLQQRLLIDHVSGTDSTSVHISASQREPGYYWVDFAIANSLPQGTFNYNTI